MTEDHISDELLFAYAEGPSSVTERGAIDSHVNSCADCWTRLDDSRSLTTAMRDEETWWVAQEMTEGKGRDLVNEFQARRNAEDAEAATMMGDLLASPDRFAAADIARDRKFHTGGVVRSLCSTARDEFWGDPRLAFMLAETACAIAEALPDDYYPSGAVAELCGTAWKEHSNACWYLGRFPEGFEALDRAERWYRRLSDAEPYLAALDLGRALLLREEEKFDEARVLAHSAAQRYANHHETLHSFEAREVEAMMLFMQGNIDAARVTFQAAFDLADQIGDIEMKARSSANLGLVSRQSGDIASASKYFLIALEIYEGLGLRSKVVHTRWAIATIALVTGNFSDAAEQLTDVIEELTTFGMMDDVAHAKLDLAEALLLLGRFDEVYTTCNALVAFFQEAKKLRGALRAAAYLKEALANRVLTWQHIQHVRGYLSGDDPRNLLFAPSPKQ